MRKNKISKKLDAARYMPPLHHTIPGEKFDVKKSRVILWLLKNPDILNYLWDHVQQSGNVKYNKNTGTWQGVDYDDN